jgi:single-strand DNA-binding protein
MLIGTLAGNIGNDAELKAIPNGTVCEFSVASSRKDKGGKETTQWVRCSLFGKRGEALQKYLTKGSRVTVIGELQVRQYDKKDGGTGVSVEIRASEVALMGGGQRNGGSGGGGSFDSPQEGDPDF